jgi:hypothetical protein
MISGKEMKTWSVWGTVPYAGGLVVEACTPEEAAENFVNGRDLRDNTEHPDVFVQERREEYEFKITTEHKIERLT